MSEDDLEIIMRKEYDTAIHDFYESDSYNPLFHMFRDFLFKLEGIITDNSLFQRSGMTRKAYNNKAKEVFIELCNEYAVQYRINIQGFIDAANSICYEYTRKFT